MLPSLTTRVIRALECSVDHLFPTVQELSQPSQEQGVPVHPTEAAPPEPASRLGSPPFFITFIITAKETSNKGHEEATPSDSNILAE